MAIAHPPLAVDTSSTASHPHWHELRTLGAHPHRRSSHTAVAWNNLMVICGGQDLREGIVPGLWACTINEQCPELEVWEDWTSDDSVAPSLGRHSAVVHCDKMYVFGGHDLLQQNANLYIFDFHTRTWSLKPPNKPGLPPAIDSHTSILHGNQMIVFGGFLGGSKSNSIFLLDIPSLTWSAPTCSNDLPAARVGHSASIHNNCMYVFGGTNEEGTKLADLWKLEIETMRWVRVQTRGEGPDGRSGHTSCVYRNYMLVFGGGKDLTKETNELWAMNFDSEQWLLLQEERKIEDPVSAIQLEEYKKSKSVKIHSSSPQTAGTSPHKKHSDSPVTPDDSPTTKKKPLQHLYEGPPSPLVGRIVGRAPYPRDGHSAVIIGEKMFIFGGDRYQMPFNDLYAFALNEASLNRAQRLKPDS